MTTAGVWIFIYTPFFTSRLVFLLLGGGRSELEAEMGGLVRQGGVVVGDD